MGIRRRVARVLHWLLSQVEHEPVSGSDHFVRVWFTVDEMLDLPIPAYQQRIYDAVARQQEAKPQYVNLDGVAFIIDADGNRVPLV